jgi:hypothetical protein
VQHEDTPNPCTTNPCTTNPCNIVDDSATLMALRHLLLSEDKPPSLQPIDILLAAYLCVRKTEDHAIYDSHATLAERLGCERQYIADSITRLAKLDWITVTKRPGRTAGLALNAQSMPATHAVRDRISEEAKSLAANYAKLLGSPSVLVDKRMAKRKHFIRNQFPSAQRIIGKCGGDRALAGKVTGFAVVYSRHRKAAQTSLYHLLLKWDAIYTEYQVTRKK